MDALSELKSNHENEQAELNNQLTACQQSLSERTKELQRLQENFDQVHEMMSNMSLLDDCLIVTCDLETDNIKYIAIRDLRIGRLRSNRISNRIGH